MATLQAINMQNTEVLGNSSPPAAEARDPKAQGWSLSLLKPALAGLHLSLFPAGFRLVRWELGAKKSEGDSFPLAIYICLANDLISLIQGRGLILENSPEQLFGEKQRVIKFSNRSAVLLFIYWCDPKVIFKSLQLHLAFFFERTNNGRIPFRMILKICKLPFHFYDIFYYFWCPKLHFFRFKIRKTQLKG